MCTYAGEIQIHTHVFEFLELKQFRSEEGDIDILVIFQQQIEVCNGFEAVYELSQDWIE